jgi:hypothetical protein
MSHNADEMHRQLGELVMLWHQVSANIAVVSVCPDKNRSIGKSAILKVRAHAALDLFYSHEIFPVLNVQAISEHITKLLTVQAKSSL